MPDSTEQLVHAIHQSPLMAVFAISGGGATGLAKLLAVPGASRTVLEAVVPYSAEALAEWLGGPPEQACSEPTARQMAMAAFRRARRLREDALVAGVACTASLATDQPKKGEHRIHCAVQTEGLTASWSLALEKGRRSRAEEERLAGSQLLNATAEACGVNERLEPDLLPDERIEHAKVVALAAWRDLLMGRVDAVRHGGHGQSQGDSPIFAETKIGTVPFPTAIFPGSFNPLHAAHRRMAAVARELLGMPVEFEIATVNVDKPALDYCEIDRRIGQFDASETIWLTRLATFEQKSRRFPGATFVVGADTLRRVADPRYYGDNVVAHQRALESIAESGCRFLVFARAEGGVLVTLDDLDLPDPLRSICREVPVGRFREDVSSTEIRQQRRM